MEQKQLPLSTTSEKTCLHTAPGSQRIGGGCHLSQLPPSQTWNLSVPVPSKHLAQPLWGCPKHIIMENQLFLGVSHALFFPSPSGRVLEVNILPSCPLSPSHMTHPTRNKWQKWLLGPASPQRVPKPHLCMKRAAHPSATE